MGSRPVHARDRATGDDESIPVPDDLRSEARLIEILTEGDYDPIIETGEELPYGSNT